jgi:hypothetical protein
MGFADALFRRRANRGGKSANMVGCVLPEAVHRYPTYRFDIALGRVARGDRALVAALEVKLAQLILDSSAEIIFYPIGVGRHVDHLIVRSLGTPYPNHVVYYADFPYNLASAPEPGFVSSHNLLPWTWDEDKGELIKGYRTQVDALFPAGRIPVASELYFSKT